VPPFVDVTGASLLTNAVIVNGQTAYRNQEYYRQALSVNNTNSALWTNLTVTGGQTVTGHVYVPQQPEVFKYDPDGNLTNDGRWAYSWDAENRLIGMTVNTNTGPQYQLTFAYDAKGRRIQKLVTTGAVPTYTNNFLYDGWNLVAETGPNNSLIRNYVWGTDLSGSQQGAGGVGGLLAIGYHGTTTTNAFVAYDGNGNVTALINALDGTLLANYEYGPFGECIRLNGPLAKNNPFRFSNKYQDDESDLLYYGRRYYKPSTGTWSNRDPIDERGGLNLYGFISNNPVSEVDVLGLDGLVYSSDGEEYFDGNPFHTDGEGYFSGVQSTSSAWFYQMFRQTSYGCSGGICNSGGDSGSPVSSFVRASVKNTSKCPLYVTCTCNIKWAGANITYAPHKIGGFSTDGNVLGAKFNDKVNAVDGRDGKSSEYVWVASGAGELPQSLSFILVAGELKQLYYGEMVTSQRANSPGSSFNLEMKGTCSCSSIQ
jgi:RHS repeat-associated protein